MPQPDGSIQKIPRRPILLENAIPCLLPNCSKYLSTKPQSAKPERLNHQKIDSKLFIVIHNAEDYKFGVRSLAELKHKLADFDFPPSWVKWYSEDTCINLIQLSKENQISISGYNSQVILFESNG